MEGARGGGLPGDLLRIRRDGLDRLTEDPHRRLDLVGRDDERWAQPHGLLAALEHEKAALEARKLDLFGGLRARELDADHQALAADVEHALREAVLDRPQAGHRLLAARGGVVDEATLEQLDGGE